MISINLSVNEAQKITRYLQILVYDYLCHVFIYLVGDQYQRVLDPNILEQVVFIRLGVLGNRISQFVLNGLLLILKGLEEYRSDTVLKLIGGTNASLICTDDNILGKNRKVSTNYLFISYVRCSTKDDTYGI